MSSLRFGDNVTAHVTLRDVVEDDLQTFFDMQLDPDANRMAAFTAKDPSDAIAFSAHWNKILNDATTITKTIIFEERVVGNICSFMQCGEREVSYWIERTEWGKGIATAALSAFLNIVQERPLFARAASDNAGSIRVLEKCGFVICGRDKFFANARNQEIDETVLRLS